MSAESVKVAVRVRPFNKREKNFAELIVDMKGNTTYLTDPNQKKAKPRSFTFDYSYWSHDGFKEKDGQMVADPSHPNASKFAGQEKVYEDLGRGVLKNAWQGYNSTLFAYGQTGSGKSWSVVGYGPNKGIVPMFCQELFGGIEEKKKAGEKLTFEVSFSMLEIYNEHVRDLLNKKPEKGGLKIRQHPKKGFYAEGLRSWAVGSYKEIEQKMDEGTTNRTIASTNMNATSSRAHTIVGINFVQKFVNKAGEERAKSAIVNLVDLAGSERAESTGATGDRLKEGAAINQSLSTLGNCIAALADHSSGKQTKVPFRDSVLTKLLKNALGGNSKTIMVAAISPAAINFEETLSTLRYADRAKQIKTIAKVNEDPTEKLIRELQEENDRLKKMLSKGEIVAMPGDEDGSAADSRQAIEDEYKALLEENAREMAEMKQAFEEKLQSARAEEAATGVEMNEIKERQKTTAHMYNLNMDPQLSGHVVHFVDGQKTIGNRQSSADIQLSGPSIQPEHCKFTMKGGKTYIERCAPNARLLLNGEPLSEKTELHHNDRLMFGSTQLFVFCLPKEASKHPGEEITYEMAQEEIAANSGFDMDTENKSRDEMLLQEDLLSMVQAVEEANSISEDLDRKKKFDIVLVSPEARGELRGRTEIFVKMTDLQSNLEWAWPKEKFVNRKFVMQEMFEKFTDGDDWELPPERDPFEEDVSAEVLIGSVKLWLQSLAYNVEIEQQLDITDLKGSEIGIMNVEVVPCDKKGREYTEDDDVWVEKPSELVGRDVHFVVKLHSARGIPNKFTDVYAKYEVFQAELTGRTQAIANTSNPDWNHRQQFDFPTAKKDLISKFENSAIMIQIWGKQKPPKQIKAVDTKKTMMKQNLTKGLNKASNSTVKQVDAEKARFALQLAVAQKRAEKAEAKVGNVKKLVEMAEMSELKRVSVALLKQLLSVTSPDEAEKCYRLLEREKTADANQNLGRNAAAAPPPARAQQSSGLCVLL